ncbi:hypothetical protein M3231_15250 [Neobacillus mesonae]|nr:hypothetical protein [Neobacillus mesonae]
MADQHAVYVVYRDGKPFSTPRAAYYSRGDATAAVTRSVEAIVGYGARAEVKAAARARFSVEAYIIAEVNAE